MSVAQCRAARRRGKLHRRFFGPSPVGAVKSANRLARRIANEKLMQLRKSKK